jgi:CRP-like cAMP-binding protein
MLGLDEQTLERRSLARNEALFRQGEKVTAIYFVEAGRLRVWQDLRAMLTYPAR